MTNLTIRWRLTLWWAGLFFVFGVLLLLAFNAFVHATLTGPLGDDLVAQLGLSDAALGPASAAARKAAAVIRNATLLALLALTAAAGAAGWWLSGRMLSPIRTITATARSVSDTSLGDRITPSGPRDELFELAQAFDDMLARLERGFDAQRAFAADASHELRTPLTLIRAEVDITLADPDATLDELAEATASIRTALEQSEQLIDRLLQLASAETIHDRHPVELAELVRGSLDLSTHGHDLEIQARLQPAVAHGDPTLLTRLVDNLVHNAVRHNVADGWIQVTTDSHGDRARLVVANSGPQLDAEQISRLADRFYRPDQSRARDNGGTGLGLAIVDAIVRAHHGTITIDSVLGGGIHVEVVLPTQPASLAHESSLVA